VLVLCFSSYAVLDFQWVSGPIRLSEKEGGWRSYFSEAVHKRCPQSGGEVGFVQCGHFAKKKGFFKLTSALFCVKTIGFFEIYGASHMGKREGVNFRDVVS